jgi:hypothetical protein
MIKKKYLIRILSTLIAVFTIGGYFIWTSYVEKVPVDEVKETRSAMLSYLSSPQFTHPEFSYQLTGTKAKLEVYQLDEHLLYFSIKKAEFDSNYTLSALCENPKKVEFAIQHNGISQLGDYSIKSENALFFRFPDSLFKVRKKVNFHVKFDQVKYLVSVKELVNFIQNKSVYGGNYYITRNGEELGVTFGMNHGAFVAVPGEPSMKRFVNVLTKGISSKEKQIQVLLNFVTNKIEYNYREALSGGETLKRPNEVLMSGTSDCSGKTILFASFLEQIGVDYRLAYMKGHIAVFVKGNFPSKNGYLLQIDGTKYHLAEASCPDFNIGETVLSDEAILSVIRYIQKVGKPSIMINKLSNRKFEL